MSNRRLRIWWIPQIPGTPFLVPVNNFVEAKLLLDTLAHYDQFQLDNNIKPDYANTGGLQEYGKEEGEFLDWHPNERESKFLDSMFGQEISFADNPLDRMSLKQVREFQLRLEIDSALQEALNRQKPIVVIDDKTPPLSNPNGFSIVIKPARDEEEKLSRASTTEIERRHRMM